MIEGFGSGSVLILTDLGGPKLYESGFTTLLKTDFILKVLSSEMDPAEIRLIR
jgi:hypothetical protein